MKPLIPLLVAAILPALDASADSTIDPAAPFAYAANLGWVSFLHDRPTAPEGVLVCEYFCSGLAYSANAGWINFGDGTPTDHIRYGNIDGTDFGVNHDGRGNLSGLAWGANIGWLNFGWAGQSDSARPRINLETGTFSGFAWGANVGWVNLGSSPLTTRAILYLHDTDGDGIGDPWEYERAGDLTTLGAATDRDGDGTSDLDEYCWDTDPMNPAQRPQSTFTLDFNASAIRIDWTASARRSYFLQDSPDLSAWNSAVGPFFKTDGTGTEIFFIPLLASETEHYFRLLVAKPLAPTAP